MSFQQPINIDKESFKAISEEDKRKLCIAWESSGLTKAAFCKANGISRTTFYPWYRKYRSSSSSPNFLPLNFQSSSATEGTHKIQFEINLPNQIQLRLAMTSQALVAFIQELNHATTIIR